MNRRILIAIAAWFATIPARALCPHELLVVANGDSIDSVLVARRYMRLYDIPDCNLVRVSLPATEQYAEGAPISADVFVSRIWDPVNQAVDERGLRPQILAWAYSCDIPFRAKTDGEDLHMMSLTGLTLLGGRPPDDPSSLVAPSWTSPLYAGPHKPGNEVPESRSLDRLRASLLDDMPVPSMFLGWTGARGNTVDEVLACLGRGRSSCGTFPKGSFLCESNKNVRAKARLWEFVPATQALAAEGAGAEIVGTFPASGAACGFLGGRENLPKSSLSLLPGAYADHLTSAAGCFHGDGQTKLSEWIRRGATASSGTVTEPRAYWEKFPSAFLFLHQRRGCGMLEAIYLSTKTPLQLLPVGDPLAAPWASPPPPPLVEPVPDRPLAGIARFRATCEGPGRPRLEWLVDGRLVARGSDFSLDTRTLPDGEHRLRVVARDGSLDVRPESHTEIRIRVQNLLDIAVPGRGGKP